MSPSPQAGTKAVIYCRVSSSKQKKVGDGLGSQESRCREFARYKGLEVVEIFQDDASGGLIDRPAFRQCFALSVNARTTRMS
ncbi:recombinase family protein [Roseibium sp.]|uniref:recombinase family protein n=1 Tax=Roseibium sp. TaxID=1936156 RepID=UPI003B52A14C